MFFVGDDVLQRPFDAVFEGVFAYGAAFLCTDRAGDLETGVGMDEELHRFSKPAFDQAGKRVDLGMGLDGIEIPGYGEMTVYVQEAAVLDDTQVVEVDPVFAAAGGETGDHLLEELHIGFIHDPSDGFAKDMIAGV